MATLVLGTVGRVVLGPLGGVVGSLLGSGLDRRLFRNGRERGAETAPEVQSASYGEPLALVHGRMRISGNLIWSAPVRASSQRSGGKRGPSSTSYNASFAVALCARRVADIGRIWADGRLIRDTNGQWLVPATMRLHVGSETQRPDPLIAAAEAAAPAYRGLAYVVFEDMPLGEYGNRIPNLSFEVVADSNQITMADVAQTIAGCAGCKLTIVGAFPEVAGMVTTSTAAASEALGPIMRSAGAILSAGTALVGRASIRTDIEFPEKADAVIAGRQTSRERVQRMAAGSAPDAIELGYYDLSRDYQPGLQRARLRAGVLVETDAIPAALTPEMAKQLIHDRLLDAQAGRQRMALRLPWRYLGVRPGDKIVYDGLVWQVREVRFEAFVLILELVQVPARFPTIGVSDGGRALDHGDRASGPTSIMVLDLPPLPGELPTQPRFWIAAGADAAWRGCSVEVSLDNGVSYQPVGSLSVSTAMGNAVTALGAASPETWDLHNWVDIKLLTDSMWLEGRPEAAVLSGANIALLGNEIIQFRAVEALGGQQFRLSGLLRGRRGTEAEVVNHATNDRFVLLSPVDMLSMPLPLEHLGAQAIVRAAGPGDSNWVITNLPIGEAAIQPLAPVHLWVRRQDGELRLNWIPASRAGFGWPDLGDVPAGESRLAWRVTVRDTLQIVSEAQVEHPEFAIPDRPGPLWFDVAQIGLTCGRTATTYIL